MRAAGRIGALCVLAFLVLTAPASAEFSIAGFNASTTSSQAGAHPDLTIGLAFPTAAGSGGDLTADGNLRALAVQLPVGFQGAPSAVRRCSQSEFGGLACGAEAQVGWVEATLIPPHGGPTAVGAPLFNLQPANEDVTAELGFSISGSFNQLPIGVRSDGDYGLTVADGGISRAFAVAAVQLTVWGVPGDSSHDPQRYDMAGNRITPGPLPRIPLFTNPTSCGGALILHAEATTYQEPERAVEAEADLPPITGCGKVRFAPTLRARPTTDVADSPSGLDVDLAVPQNLDPDGLASGQLRDLAMTLPEGLVVNPSGANGLEVCSPEQIGLKSAAGNPIARFGLEPPSCPAASSLGEVEVVTPLLTEPVDGTVYVGTPYRNPFGSLLSVYLSIRGQGLDIKLAGRVQPNPETGRLTITFRENPQLPIEHLRLRLFKGPLAPLRTPAVCGNYATTSSLTPWSAPESGPPATPKNDYSIDRAPGGGSCARSGAGLPNSPSFEAGSTASIAGRFLPFVFNLSREDGTQQFGAVTVTPPPGLLAKLAGTESCPDQALALAAGRSGRAEEASPACPAGSRVGHVFVQAGAGPEPYTVPGSAYLAGPYKGAPFSLAIVTPAVAGPFDLGTVVVRAALRLDSVAARITATSDPIPSIIEGIPLDVRSVSIRFDRPGFTVNPTSCDPREVEGSLLTASGAMASLTSHFQVGECRRLGFKPRLSLRLLGPTHRSAHPELRATLKMPKRSASVSRAVLTLPDTEFLENLHLRAVCSSEQYAANRCPSGSSLGYARAWSPLLDRRLRGPVYLRASAHRLPDLEASLDGRVHVDLTGRLDAVDRRLRVTLGGAPDVPVSKFVLTMHGGRKGLLVNNTELCRTRPRARVELTGQNGERSVSKPLLNIGCGRKPQPIATS